MFSIFYKIKIVSQLYEELRYLSQCFYPLMAQLLLISLYNLMPELWREMEYGKFYKHLISNEYCSACRFYLSSEKN